jgi:EAL domain-containing protein (putative c-di-GMP-specific phosphodiesterase class I)/CheY-like chemotaxis protein
MSDRSLFALDAAERRPILAAALDRAIGSAEVSLAYQPQISLRDDRLVGFEALLRWNHPEFGPIEPLDFIPVAEASGLIARLGDWALEAVCRQIAAWNELGFDDIKVAVNMSPVQFRDGTAEHMLATLDRHGVDPSRLEIEITESAAIRDIETVINICGRLKAAGVGIAIDDFGTGHSALAYLLRLPLTTLKVDRAFVDPIPAQRAACGIVAAIIAMAKVLELNVVVEGVETIEQAAFVRNHGAEVIQGWLVGRTIPPGDATRLLRERRRAAIDGHKPPHVLVVDDIREGADLIMIGLQRRGIPCDVAYTGPAALRMIAAEPDKWDVLVADQVMPGLTGLDVIVGAKKIKPGMRAILCTGYSESVGEREALGAGADGFLMKPVMPNDVADLIKRLTGGR